MKIRYIDHAFSPASLEVIEQANEIIADYQQQGFRLTLRQLYYQFVARDLIPNTQRSYKRLGSIISDARRAGLIDWEAIEDRTRNLRSLATWEGPAEIVGACATEFRIDRWADQPCRAEVWIEKDALLGVVEGACNEWRVPFFSCRGYTSDSEIWNAARRLAGYVDDGHKVIVFHLGDHDPSGIDMSRDIADRLALFGCDEDVTVNRIALTMEQVEQHRPPPNPAKVTDSRYEAYQEEYGEESWELDALDPTTLAGLIREHVGRIVDARAWAGSAEQEQDHRQGLGAAARRWDDVADFLAGPED